MKKLLAIGAVIVLLCMFVSSIIMFFYCKKVEYKLDTAIAIEQPLCGNNVISVIDTIYGKKYIIDIDTITGKASIIGIRHNPIVIEDSVQ